MPATGETLRFEQIHIEVARNATDDFNPFHDKNRWRNVVGNPFGGPIVLGFQLECLIAQHMRLYREQHDEEELIARKNLRFSNYEFKFVNAVRAGQAISINVKESRFKPGDNTVLANRVSLKADGKLAMAGYKRESASPLYLPDIDPTDLGNLNQAQDRAFLADKSFFLKRKYMTTSNAKNFLSGSLVEQSDYIDELAERVYFPEIFPCALLSCALLERAWQQGHDFELEPMVYKSHNISIDRDLLHDLHSNDALHLLSREADPAAQTPSYECFGVIGSDRLLFRARIDLMPLAAETQ
jgi:hypothetical protein